MALSKVEGNKEKCPVCKEDIICVLKPASGNYAARLQWQNLNTETGQSTGESHYKSDGTNVTCGTIIEDPKNKPSKPITSEKVEQKKEIVPDRGAISEAIKAFATVYGDAIPVCIELAKNLHFGNKYDESQLVTDTQRVLRDFIVFYSAYRLK